MTSSWYLATMRTRSSRKRWNVQAMPAQRWLFVQDWKRRSGDLSSPLAITASSPEEKDSFFEPAADKIYRHPTFYDVPDSIKHM